MKLKLPIIQNSYTKKFTQKNIIQTKNMLEYIRQTRENQENLNNEISYRNRIRKIMEELKEKLAWIEKTLENLDKNTCNSLCDLKNSLREEQHKIINNIENLELDIYYSTDRINYYTRICNSVITTG